MLRTYFKYALLAAAAVYVVVATTPISKEIGRISPRMAALFRPVLFNFGEEYRDGSVLGLNIGQSKADVARHFVENYNGRFSLSIRDGQVRPINETFMRPTGISEFVELVERKDTLQISADDTPKLGFILRFLDDRLIAIRVYWVNHGK